MALYTARLIGYSITIFIPHFTEEAVGIVIQLTYVLNFVHSDLHIHTCYFI